MPHGGPWARDVLGWDLWAQFLANRGYAVLQRQYRGSEGWGQTLWRAGDGEWGQKMQDDKDDGARWLATRGIADPDRIAIYGYSYGGFAAMAARVRPSALPDLRGSRDSSRTHRRIRLSDSGIHRRGPPSSTAIRMTGG